jgi:hypothetical protein
MYLYYIGEDQTINIAVTAKINDLTFNRIVDKGFDKLTAFQQECVTEAAKAQYSYYEKNGIDNTVNEENIASISVEDFNVSLNNSSEKSSTSNKPYNTSSVCYQLLKQTGLMCRAL